MILENPVNINLFEIPEKEGVSYAPTILYPALIRPLKNQLTLLQAVKLLRKEGFHVNVELVGSIRDVKYYFELRKFIKQEKLENSVKIIPGVPYDSMIEYYTKADIIVVPSLQESFGMVVPEAMAAGKPVVASNIPAFREKIDDKRDGFLINPKDPDDISEKISRIIVSYSLQKKFKRRARRKAISRWHPKIVGEKLIRFYLEIVRKEDEERASFEYHSRL
ncbi:glycosyltransferase family 4 protein [Pyrococcus woesei]|uniref:glycosyltransferase family 4 protein n=1 Tax=Pyrococcus woesei TaxID=2262 RepID=UPI003D2F00A8